jgi:predicted SAM-dependent methyltransferase
MKLHLGCGKRRINLPNWINIDCQEFPGVVDVVADILDLPIGWKGNVDLIYSCCNIEHVVDHKAALRHWYGLLKPGGELYISTSDFRAAACAYLLDGVSLTKLRGILVGGQKDSTDTHKCLFDEATLTKALEDAGFDDVRRYDWREFEPFAQDPNYDDFSRSYIPHMDFVHGRLMVVNLRAVKP